MSSNTPQSKQTLIKQVSRQRPFPLVLTSLWLLITLILWLAPKNDFSLVERRKLQTTPTATRSSIMNGYYMEDVELYLQDHFPLRQYFRQFKSLAARFPLGLKEVNNYLYLDGKLTRLPSAQSEERLTKGFQKTAALIRPLVADGSAHCFSAVIPDKNLYLSRTNDLPGPSEERVQELARTYWDFTEVLDLRGKLSLDSFYSTDLHWRQEGLLEVAKYILSKLQVNSSFETYEQSLIREDFYGAYYGQAALPVAPDRLVILNHPDLKEAIVKHLDENKSEQVYDLAAAEGRDPYDIFLSGPSSLVTIENKKASSERTLVIFRDSFASSLTPLLVPYYQKIILIDLRYFPSKLVEEQVDLKNESTDVLMLYSLPILEESASLR